MDDRYRKLLMIFMALFFISLIANGYLGYKFYQFNKILPAIVPSPSVTEEMSNMQEVSGTVTESANDNLTIVKEDGSTQSFIYSPGASIVRLLNDDGTYTEANFNDIKKDNLVYIIYQTEQDGKNYTIKIDILK